MHNPSVLNELHAPMDPESLCTGAGRKASEPLPDCSPAFDRYPPAGPGENQEPFLSDS